MVGVSVGLKNPRDYVALLPGELHDRMDRVRVDGAGIGIVVQYRIDHRRLLRGGVGDNVGYGVNVLIEKRVNDGSSAHGLLFCSRARALLKKSSS